MRIDLDYPPEEAVPYVELYEKTHKLLKEEERRARRLEERRDELLALVAKLSQTVPLESEVAEAIEQRGRLLAEIGTLRASYEELKRDSLAIIERKDIQIEELHGRIRKLEGAEVEDGGQADDQALSWPTPDEPPDDCNHNYLTASILNGEIIGQNCMNCWLPVGVPCNPEPANDVPQAQIELLAAELATTKNWVKFSPIEQFADGFRAYLNDADPAATDGALAGWLAAHIYKASDDAR